MENGVGDALCIQALHQVMQCTAQAAFAREVGARLAQHRIPALPQQVFVDHFRLLCHFSLRCLGHVTGFDHVVCRRLYPDSLSPANWTCSR